ncbi:TPA: bacteriocin immunity protein [Citrobacter freundii]|uniref:bacteriocin immunity protein n=1 Tax=Citrobacter freundii TaxID=546 RepID=UPI00122FD94C|nr:bacteriocin immunity protein [Citrobacter freundii]ELJ2049197.1 bacteriocin immunity protein [Citrobacter freundii]KAA3564744.1 bacteriocin immunity protein [Citrobacter freundii]MBA8048389.1 bacteriocin immunity protein [Citrobacter freundii]HAT3774311.1 bacteriocin immunity protein [Citrobacter freundii]HCA7356432.1 bacteriocin immunity protein [Citrobacter freundii]
MNHLKQKLEDYTEAEFIEFIEFLNELFENPNNLKGREFESHSNMLVKHFDKIVDHPEGNGLTFYPPDDSEDSLQGVINEIKRWRKFQGRPSFKQLI